MYISVSKLTVISIHFVSTDNLFCHVLNTGTLATNTRTSERMKCQAKYLTLCVVIALVLDDVPTDTHKNIDSNGNYETIIMGTVQSYSY